MSTARTAPPRLEYIVGLASRSGVVSTPDGSTLGGEMLRAIHVPDARMREVTAALDAIGTGAGEFAWERQRHVAVEHWTPEHDDEHTLGELAVAAYCYIDQARRQTSPPRPEATIRTPGTPPANWPWAPEWWKPSDDPRVNLRKAGALLAAEYDRLERAAARANRRWAVYRTRGSHLLLTGHAFTAVREIADGGHVDQQVTYQQAHVHGHGIALILVTVLDHQPTTADLNDLGWPE